MGRSRKKKVVSPEIIRIGPYDVEVGSGFDHFSDGLFALQASVTLETMCLVALGFDHLIEAGIEISDQQYYAALVAAASGERPEQRTPDLLEIAQDEILERTLQQLRARIEARVQQEKHKAE